MSTTLISITIKVLLYSAICYLIQLCFRFFTPILIPSFNELTNRNKVLWYNKGVSTVHAVIMFLLTVYYWLFINPLQDIHYRNNSNDNTIGMLNNTDYDSYEARSLVVMMGYLVYDMIFELTSGKQLDTLAHHFLGLLSHSSTVYSKNNAAAYYSMLVLIAEGSTPSLNLSWLLHQLKLTNTVAFQFAVMSLLLLFFLLRVLLGPYMVIHCYINADEWGTDSFHRALFYFNISIIFLFCLLNFYWFYKLIEVAMKANKKKD